MLRYNSKNHTYSYYSPTDSGLNRFPIYSRSLPLVDLIHALTKPFDAFSGDRSQSGASRLLTFSLSFPNGFVRNRNTPLVQKSLCDWFSCERRIIDRVKCIVVITLVLLLRLYALHKEILQINWTFLSQIDLKQ